MRILPLESKELSLKEWLTRHFAQPIAMFEEDRKPKSSLLVTPGYHRDDSQSLILLKESLLLTYPIDGFNFAQPQIHAHDAWSFLSTFFGLPNYGIGQKKENEDGTALGLGLKNLELIFKNFIGGWEWNEDTAQSKKNLQIILLATGITSLLLPLLKIAGIFLKTAINILKIFTEFLPLVLQNETARLMKEMFYWANPSKTDGVSNWARKIAWIGIVMLGIIHYAAKMMTIFGRAATSPLKSAKLAWFYCSELQGKLGKFLGGLAVVLSILLSTAIWAGLSPFIFHMIPTQIIGFFTQGSLASIVNPIFNGIAQMGQVFAPIFNPIIASISSLLSVKILTAFVNLGLGLGILAVPLLSALKLILEKCNHLWREKYPKKNPVQPSPHRASFFSLSKNDSSQDSERSDEAEALASTQR